jgi:hypothetical protein
VSLRARADSSRDGSKPQGLHHKAHEVPKVAIRANSTAVPLYGGRRTRCGPIIPKAFRGAEPRRPRRRLWRLRYGLVGLEPVMSRVEARYVT